MSTAAAILTIIVPLAAFLVPGLVLVPRPRSVTELPGAAARVVLWSITLLILISFLLTALQLPVQLTPVFTVLAMGIGLLINRDHLFTKPKRLWHSLTVVLIAIAITALFAVPFLLIHDGLPTGDSQKAIIWAQQILSNQQLPDYTQALTLLNRDPVDFYTPGLHTLTAALMSLTPHSLVAIGFFSIAAGVAVAYIAAALAIEVLPERARTAAFLVPLFVLTNLRFLRYLREPGYHFQNLVGELLLFGVLYLALAQFKKRSWSDVVLGIAALVALALTHQFSTFIAGFLLLPVALRMFLTRREKTFQFISESRLATSALTATLLLLIASGFALGLHQKIPHIFTTTPHLINLVPGPDDYLRIMGAAWFVAGLSGLLLLARNRGDQFSRSRRGRQVRHRRTGDKRRENLVSEGSRIAFMLSTLVLLVLSQGPRLGIDIPPVRALFYTVVPLSITAAYLISWLIEKIRAVKSITPRTLAYFAVALLVVVPTISSTAKAYALSHTVRTNATLTAEQQVLIELIASSPDGPVLIDDYNRRSASWLSLAGTGMFTRIAADLERQMNEAAQSPERYQLYLKQLDFEKIFALGSKPEIVELMSKHNIRWVTGIENSSQAAFHYNPALQEVARAGDIVVYESADSVAEKDPLQSWLLAPSTLANDIGDREDTFEHLPASLRSTRLSEPIVDGTRTFRTTTAPLIPLHFNVGDFTRLLWDKEKTNRPDTSVELLIQITPRPQQPLTISTPIGSIYPLPSDGATLKIPAHEVPFDDDGFIVMTLHNPIQQAVNIDLIALGLARTP